MAPYGMWNNTKLDYKDNNLPGALRKARKLVAATSMFVWSVQAKIVVSLALSLSLCLCMAVRLGKEEGPKTLHFFRRGEGGRGGGGEEGEGRMAEREIVSSI